MPSKPDSLSIDPRLPLTPRELSAAQIIQEWFDKKGFAPSLVELGHELDLESKSGVHRLISALVEKGWATRHKSRNRGVKLTARIPMPLEFTDTREVVNVALEAIEDLRRLHQFEARARELAGRLQTAIGGGRPAVELTKTGRAAAELIPVRAVNTPSTGHEGGQ